MVASPEVSTRRLLAALALVALAAGFGQFDAVTALGDVAKSFGTVTSASTFTARAGLSGSTLGIALSVLRAASLLALPLASLADRLGRRRVLYWCGVAGLLVTASASLSPGFWWFVALFAIARPALSAASTLATVLTTELTDARHRVTALAILAAGAAVGAGLSAALHGVVRGTDGFRILFATALVPMALVAVLVPRLPETRPATHDLHAPRLGAIPAALRGRLGIVMAVWAATGAITGPASGYAFVYGERILKISPLEVSTVVVLSGIPGLVGLFVGRRLADRNGRRLTVAIGVLGTAATSVLAYSGGRADFICGYIVGVFAGAILSPAGAALATESFPAAVRASAGGWLVVAGVVGAICGYAVFGVVADASGTAWASLATFVPTLPVLLLLRRLDETRGAVLA